MHPAIHIMIWGTALVLTGIAAFLKRYPDTIAGYNTLSDAKKKNVDLRGMADYIYKGMLIVAWSMVPITYIIYLFGGGDEGTAWGMVAWLVVGMVTVAILSQKFDHNKKKPN